MQRRALGHFSQLLGSLGSGKAEVSGWLLHTRVVFKFIKYRRAFSLLHSLIKLEGEEEHTKASRGVQRRTVRAVGRETGGGHLYPRGVYRVLMPQPPH